MTYRIAQDAEYKGHDYWRWWAWIEDDGSGLGAVEEVAWILHPTFKVQRVVSRDRSTRFRLDTSGWGTFLLRAELTLGSGESVMLHRHLELEYPDDRDADPKPSGIGPDKPSAARKDAKTGARKGASGAGGALTVFLSYSARDTRLAAQLKRGLETWGIQWLDSTSVKAGAPVAEAVEQLISQADAVVGIVGDDEVSPWVLRELESGLASAKPSVALVAEGSSPSGLPSAIEQYPLPRTEGGHLVRQLFSSLKGG